MSGILDEGVAVVDCAYNELGLCVNKGVAPLEDESEESCRPATAHAEARAEVVVPAGGIPKWVGGILSSGGAAP